MQIQSRLYKGVAAWAPVLGLTAIGTTLCVWLWGRTGEIVLDFGDELYVAWQLSRGRFLYRDVAYEFGPLSPNFNALSMRLFGPGLQTILIANLLVLIAVTAMLYSLLRAISGTWTAFVATGFFLAVFALSSSTAIANYNFLTPYRHGITHGFLLCVAEIWCIDWFYRRGSMKAVITGGLATGLAFLTKPEMFLGCAVTFCLGMGGAMWARGDRRIIRVAAAALTGMIVPVLAAFCIYSLVLPASNALGSVSGGWQSINKPFVISTPFYKKQLGTDRLGYGVWRMMVYAGLYAVMGTFLAGVALIGGRAFRGRRIAVILVGSLLGIGMGWGLLLAGSHCQSFWGDFARGFPVLAGLTLAATGVRLVRARATDGRRAVLQWTMAVLSLALLAKIFFNVRIYHYGFVLAAPCGMLAIVALTSWLSAWVERRGGSTLIVQLGGLGLLIGVVIGNVFVTHQFLVERTLVVPLALGGRAWISPLDSSAADAIQWLAHVPGTAVVLPDAGGINFAAARSSSVPYTVLNPMVLAIDGEANVMGAFERKPPDFILVMKFDEHAFGPRWFGIDYGLQLSRWIEEWYEPVRIFNRGPRPIEVLAFKRPAAP